MTKKVIIEPGATTGTQYTYGDNTWGDLLTSYGDLTFTYDEIGNVVSEQKAGSSSKTYYNWGKGRQLESISYGTSAQSATTVVEHAYNSDGVRISKTLSAGGDDLPFDSNHPRRQ